MDFFSKKAPRSPELGLADCSATANSAGFSNCRNGSAADRGEYCQAAGANRVRFLLRQIRFFVRYGPTNHAVPKSAVSAVLYRHHISIMGIVALIRQTEA
jgi:hypothetical protein